MTARASSSAFFRSGSLETGSLGVNARLPRSSGRDGNDNDHDSDHDENELDRIDLFSRSMLDNISVPDTLTLIMTAFGHTSQLTQRCAIAPMLPCVGYWVSLPQADSINLEGIT